jgi:hypothetical protein
MDQSSLRSERIQIPDANGNAQRNFSMLSHQQTTPETLGMSAGSSSLRLGTLTSIKERA